MFERPGNRVVTVVSTDLLSHSMDDDCNLTFSWLSHASRHYGETENFSGRVQEVGEGTRFTFFLIFSFSGKASNKYRNKIQLGFEPKTSLLVRSYH